MQFDLRRVCGRLYWLEHPLFLVSIAVLALNDHVLKLHFPSWWTGKLSDCAGVAVVGTLLSVLAGPARGAVITTVGFSLLKTWPGVAELAAPILGGVTTRDSTDLLALVVLAPIFLALHRRGSHGRVTAGGPLTSPAVEAELAATGGTAHRRRGPILSAALPALGALAAVLTATATSCGPDPAVIQVTAQDGSFYALITRSYAPRWTRSDDGGRSWSQSAPPGEVAPSSPAYDGYADEPTGPLEACAQDGTCFRLRDRRAVEKRTPGSGWVEEARLSDAEFNSISTGCASAQRGVLRSVAVIERPGGHHAVASLGADGVLVRQDNGMWVQVATVLARTEGKSGLGVALVWLAIGLGLLAIFGPLAYLVGRDANRRGRNGWVWGVLFLWQPVIVGVAYLVVVRRKRPSTNPPDEVSELGESGTRPHSDP